MEKDNRTSKLLLTIFVIISVALGGFIIYDKVLKKEEIVQCNEKNISKNDDYIKDFYSNMKKNRKLDVKYGLLEVILDKSGNVYYRVSEEITNKTVLGVQDAKQKYEIEGYSTLVDSPSGWVSANYIEGYKLGISNVVSLYSEYDFAGNDVYIFIKENGTIGLLKCHEKNGEVEILEFSETVDKYKNIIGVNSSVSTNNGGYQLYDIYGNSYVGE